MKELARHKEAEHYFDMYNRGSIKESAMLGNHLAEVAVDVLLKVGKAVVQHSFSIDMQPDKEIILLKR